MLPWGQSFDTKQPSKGLGVSESSSSSFEVEPEGGLDRFRKLLNAPFDLVVVIGTQRLRTPLKLIKPGVAEGAADLKLEETRQGGDEDAIILARKRFETVLPVNSSFACKPREFLASLDPEPCIACCVAHFKGGKRLRA
jgi:hypothetical protein